MSIQQRDSRYRVWHKRDTGLEGAGVDLPRASPDAKLLCVPEGTLKRLCSTVLHAAKENSNRLVLNTVLLEVAEGRLQATATDTFRLVMATADGMAPGEAIAIVPANTVRALLPHLGATNDWSVTFQTEPPNPGPEDASSGMIVQTIDLHVQIGPMGKYPNYGKVIPGAHTSEAVFDREELLAALRRLAPVAALDGNRLMMARSEPYNATVRVCTTDLSDDAIAEEALDADGDGPTESMGVSAKYLTDAVKALGASPEVTIEFNGPLNPMRVTGSGAEGVATVLMPTGMA